MFKNLSVVALILLFTNTYSQNKNLLGVWVLDKVIYADGKDIEVNKELFSYKLIYEVRNNKITINDRAFDAVFSDKSIQTTTRKIDYELRSGYLLIRDNDEDKLYAFLKREDFIKKYPEFKPKEAIRNGDILWIADDVTKPSYESDHFPTNLLANSMFRSSKNDDLYFKAEYVVTTDSKIRDIKIIDGYDSSFDSEFLSAIREAENAVHNPYAHNLLVIREIHFLRYLKDLKNKEDISFFKIIEKGEQYYNKQQFEKAIAEFEKIQNPNIGLNRFKTTIDQANLKLGISYLGTNQIAKACTTFRSIGDKTNFTVRNYLINFCEINIE